MEDLEKSLNNLRLFDEFTNKRKKQKIYSKQSDVIELIQSVKTKKIITVDEINDITSKFVDMKIDLQQQVKNKIECLVKKEINLNKIKELDEKFNNAIMEMIMNYNKRDIYNLYVNNPPPYTECH